MAKISDELRKWCDMSCGDKTISKLAGRIDSEMVELLANFADRIRMLAAKEDRQCQ